MGAGMLESAVRWLRPSRRSDSAPPSPPSQVPAQPQAPAEVQAHEAEPADEVGYDLPLQLDPRRRCRLRSLAYQLQHSCREQAQAPPPLPPPPQPSQPSQPPQRRRPKPQKQLVLKRSCSSGEGRALHATSPRSDAVEFVGDCADLCRVDDLVQRAAREDLDAVSRALGGQPAYSGCRPAALLRLATSTPQLSGEQALLALECALFAVGPAFTPRELVEELTRLYECAQSVGCAKCGDGEGDGEGAGEGEGEGEGDGDGNAHAHAHAHAGSGSWTPVRVNDSLTCTSAQELLAFAMLRWLLWWRGALVVAADGEVALVFHRLLGRMTADAACRHEADELRRRPRDAGRERERDEARGGAQAGLASAIEVTLFEAMRYLRRSSSVGLLDQAVPESAGAGAALFELDPPEPLLALLGLAGQSSAAATRGRCILSAASRRIWTRSSHLHSRARRALGGALHRRYASEMTVGSAGPAVAKDIANSEGLGLGLGLGLSLSLSLDYDGGSIDGGDSGCIEDAHLQAGTTTGTDSPGSTSSPSSTQIESSPQPRAGFLSLRPSAAPFDDGDDRHQSSQRSLQRRQSGCIAVVLGAFRRAGSMEHSRRRHGGGSSSGSSGSDSQSSSNPSRLSSSSPSGSSIPSSACLPRLSPARTLPVNAVAAATTQLMLDNNSADAVARQLDAFLRHTMYRKVTLASLARLARAGADGDVGQASQHLARMISLFNVVAVWVEITVLGQARRCAASRIAALRFFVRAAQSLRDLRNYHLLFAVVAGLGQPSLRWVWDLNVSRDRELGALFCGLQRICSPKRNYLVYRADTTKSAAGAAALGLVPFLGVALKDLAALGRALAAAPPPGPSGPAAAQAPSDSPAQASLRCFAYACSMLSGATREGADARDEGAEVRRLIYHTLQALWPPRS